MFSRPVVVLPLLAVPLVAGGLHALATGTPDATVGDHRSAPAASVADPADPVAGSRAALDRAEIPLGLLESGFVRLNDGAAQLDDGAGELADGMARARSGGTELADGLGRLDAGLGELGDGSARLNEGVGALVGALSGAAAVQGQVVQILSDTIEDLSTVDSDAARRAVDQLTALRDVVQSNGMADLPARLEELRAGSQEITYQLDDPGSPFAGGVNRAADGAAQLRDGLIALDDGGRRLTDGTNELVTRVDPVDGVLASLAGALDDARAALPPPDAAQSADIAMAASGRSVAPAFPIAVLILIGSTLAAGTARRNGMWAVLPASVTAICGWVTLVGSGLPTNSATLAAAGGFVALGVAAVTATTGAIFVSVGRSLGRWLAAVIVLVQVLIGAIAVIADGRAASVLSMFTPIGWLVSGTTAVAEQAPLRQLAVPVLVFGTALAIALSVLAAARSASEVPGRSDPIDADTAGATADHAPVPPSASELDDLDITTSDAVALVAAGRVDSGESAGADHTSPDGS